MEPNLNRWRLENELVLAVINAPLLVVLGWLHAGSRPTLRTLENAAELGRLSVFRTLLDHLDRSGRAALPDLMDCEAMLDDDDMLDAWLERLTPDELNEQTGRFDYPAWFVAFINTPVVDRENQYDGARAARLPHVLAKLRDAGANLFAMGNDPDEIGFWLDDDPHYAALRMLQRIRLEREAEAEAARAESSRP
ncbi:hypothetical protein [Paraburkholderia tropica]|uniref:hypothetical protein n=1 Tax=Paraburkholderia tropica TaxID=92647 RepID=UPI001F2B96B8|nr:hypothetical protein [Paraburkholderia tropica]